MGMCSVISLRPISMLAAAAAVLLIPAATAIAQRQQPSPEQRVDRLEKQVEQMQRQVFPKGRPADSAGFADDPAASQSAVVALDQRIDALERQMADILRLSEENGHLLQTLQSEVGKARSDNDARIAAIEQRFAQSVVEPAVPAIAPIGATTPVKDKVKPAVVPPQTGDVSGAGPALDPGEAAYTEGFKAWEAGRYDEAIASFRAFTSAYPKHRRVSFANNLVGRALIEKGDARAAAQALLANYRRDPKGERAPDSLLYLGQALMKLGQPGQACKAYSELDAVYGVKIRPDLKKLETVAKTEAHC